MHRAFVNSLPKSGTNLVVKALLMMGMREVFSVSAGLVRARTLASAVRRVFWYPLGQSYQVGIDTPAEIARWPIDARLRRLRAGDFGAGHVGYTSVLLDKIKLDGIRPILMTRDPRAVLVSGIEYVLREPHHALHRSFRSLERPAQIERMLLGATVGGFELRPLRERCMALAPWYRDPEVLWLKFEELVGHRGGGSDHRQREVLTGLAEYLGIDTTIVDDVAAGLWGPGRATFRQGTIEGWRDALPADILAQVTSELRSVLVEWGYQS